MLFANLTQRVPAWLLLVVICLLAYLPSFGNQFVWDDEQFIYSNRIVREFSVGEIFSTSTTAGAGVASNYYRPLTTLSFAIDHAIWGLTPFGFHLTNTVLHILAGLILLKLLRSLHIPKAAAFWISLFFLIHPLQTEAVVYVNSRGDSLYTFFLLAGALLFYKSFSFVTRNFFPAGIELSVSKLHLLIGSALCFLLSILSKEIALAGIGIYGLLLLNHIFSQRNVKLALTSARAQIITLVALTAGLIGYLALRFFKLSFASEASFYAGTPYGSSLLVRLGTFCHALWEYWRLLLFPYPLHMERTLAIPTELTPQIVGAILILSTVFVAGIVQWRKKQNTTMLFGLFWFLGLLVPVSGIVPINGLMYEHWLYLPMVGFWLVLWSGMEEMIVARKFLSTLLQFIMPVVAIIFVLLTVRQNYLWGEPERFYRYTIQYTDSARLRNNLGMTLASKGKWEEAIDAYSQAVAQSDAYPQTHHNLGNLYRKLNRTQEAEVEYRAALTLDPSFLFSYLGLFELYVEKAEYASALQVLDDVESRGINPANLRMLRATVTTLQTASESARIKSP